MNKISIGARRIIMAAVHPFLCDWLNTHIKSADVRLAKAASSA